MLACTGSRNADLAAKGDVSPNLAQQEDMALRQNDASTRSRRIARRRKADQSPSGDCRRKSSVAGNVTHAWITRPNGYIAATLVRSAEKKLAHHSFLP